MKWKGHACIWLTYMTQNCKVKYVSKTNKLSFIKLWMLLVQSTPRNAIRNIFYVTILHINFFTIISPFTKNSPSITSEWPTWIPLFWRFSSVPNTLQQHFLCSCYCWAFHFNNIMVISEDKLKEGPAEGGTTSKGELH